MEAAGAGLLPDAHKLGEVLPSLICTSCTKVPKKTVCDTPVKNRKSKQDMLPAAGRKEFWLSNRITQGKSALSLAEPHTGEASQTPAEVSAMCPCCC